MTTINVLVSCNQPVIAVVNDLLGVWYMVSLQKVTTQMMYSKQGMYFKTKTGHIRCNRPSTWYTNLFGKPSLTFNTVLVLEGFIEKEYSVKV